MGAAGRCHKGADTAAARLNAPSKCLYYCVINRCCRDKPIRVQVLSRKEKEIEDFTSGFENSNSLDFPENVCLYEISRWHYAIGEERGPGDNLKTYRGAEQGRTRRRSMPK
jgi:hypothetical protein